ASAQNFSVGRVGRDQLALGVLAEPNTRVEHLLGALGLTRQLVHGLLAGHLDQARASIGHSSLRQVFAAGQTLSTDTQRITVLSVEDYRAGFAVPPRVELRDRHSRSFTSPPALDARDDQGRHYVLTRAGGGRLETATGYVLSIAFRSREPLGDEVRSLHL